MMGKRYHYDSKGRSTGFSSDEGPGTRNAKALMFAFALLVLMSMCGIDIKRGSSRPSDQADQFGGRSFGSDDRTTRADLGDSVYVVTGRANLRYDTQATGTPIGELAPGEEIVGEPRKGADSRTWVMLTEGPKSGSFVWAGNLRLASDRPQAALRQSAVRPDAVRPDSRNDVDCSVVVSYFDVAFKEQGVSDDQLDLIASLQTWYRKKALIEASKRGVESVEERAMLLTTPGSRDLQIMKDAFAECTRRAVSEGLK